MSQRDDILAVRDLVRHFPTKTGAFRHGTVKAVDGVSFTVREGETLGLVGESGCGKSTLGRVLVQLTPPTSGEMRFRGEAVTDTSARTLRKLRRNVQMVFQDPFASLNPRMTVGEIVAEPLRNFGIATGSEADRLVRETLDTCGLGRTTLDRYPREFSGGQRQRIGIARAIVIRPSFIVADEPVSALDVSIQAQIVNLLVDLQAELGLTYLFISHDLSVVRYISDRVAVMYLGRIVEIAPAEDLFDRPAHPYTRVLMSSVPIPDPQAEAQRRPIALQGEIPSPLHPPSGCRFHTRCPWARFPICSNVEPPDVAIGPDRRAACHFADEIVKLPKNTTPASMTITA
jgi:oligopeptide transport system ATP-binding protein